MELSPPSTKSGLAKWKKMNKHQQHWCPVASIPVNGITSSTAPLMCAQHPLGPTQSAPRGRFVLQVGDALLDAECVHAHAACAPTFSALAVSERVLAFLELRQRALVGDQIHGARTFHRAFQLSLQIHTHMRTPGQLSQTLPRLRAQC